MLTHSLYLNSPAFILMTLPLTSEKKRGTHQRSLTEANQEHEGSGSGDWCSSKAQRLVLILIHAIPCLPDFHTHSLLNPWCSQTAQRCGPDINTCYSLLSRFPCTLLVDAAALAPLCSLLAYQTGFCIKPHCTRKRDFFTSMLQSEETLSAWRISDKAWSIKTHIKSVLCPSSC